MDQKEEILDKTNGGLKVISTMAKNVIGIFLSILVIVLFAVIASGLFLDGKIWIITMILTRS